MVSRIPASWRDDLAAARARRSAGLPGDERPPVVVGTNGEPPRPLADVIATLHGVHRDYLSLLLTRQQAAWPDFASGAAGDATLGNESEGARSVELLDPAGLGAARRAAAGAAETRVRAGMDHMRDDLVRRRERQALVQRYTDRRKPFARWVLIL